MRGSKLGANWILATVALGALVHCGSKKSESAKASFEVVPEQPIVITANTTLDGEVVTAPWVKFNVNMTNGSSQPVTIVALTAKIYAPNSTTPGTWAADPGAKSITTDTLICTYTSFGTWAPNETKALELPGSAACKRSPISFYISALEEPKSGSYRYRVVLKPIGWFGTESAPTDRFDTQLTFTTR